MPYNKRGYIQNSQHRLLQAMKYYLLVRDYDSLLTILEKSIFLFKPYPDDYSGVCLR